MDINWSYKNKSRVFDTKENGGNRRVKIFLT